MGRHRANDNTPRAHRVPDTGNYEGRHEGEKGCFGLLMLPVVATVLTVVLAWIVR